MEKVRNKIQEREEFLNAVDTVCGTCHYCEEEYCSSCPVRKTVDELEN